MKKLFISLLFFTLCGALSACGTVNYAPGKAGMAPTPPDGGVNVIG